METITEKKLTHRKSTSPLFLCKTFDSIKKCSFNNEETKNQYDKDKIFHFL